MDRVHHQGHRHGKDGADHRIHASSHFVVASQSVRADPVAKIVAAAREHQPDIIGLCALMTTTLPQIDHSIAALKAAGIPARFMVGGAVLTPEYAKKAGADEYAADAVVAVALAKRLVKQAK